MTRTAEIVAVGSELLTPEKTDTNSLWLTEKLNEAGVEVMLKTIVGDDEARLEETIRDAVKRSDIVITTGGLGPTEDDVTRQVSGRAVGRELVYHDELEAHLRERFRSWGREMPEINKRQAYIIEGAEILPNPNGSAVGMMLENVTLENVTPPSRRLSGGRPALRGARPRDAAGTAAGTDGVTSAGGATLVVLPGPPRELKPMFETYVLPKLKERTGEIYIKRRILRVSGMGESAVDEAIAPVYRAYPNVQTSILFSKSEIEVHLTAKSEREAEAVNVLDELAGKIRDTLGLAVFAMNGETLEEVVGRMLSESGETLAVAESCTGGLIGMRLTEVPGSSAYFLEGAITYSNEAKMRMLGVPEATIAGHGAVSAETAEAMATGIRERSGADYGIAVTGVAGPGGGTDEKPVGTVFIGYSDASQTRSVRFNFPGDRFLIRWRSSQAALDYLRRRMLKTKAV